MIRWDEPIEAVHEDGRVEPSVVFDGYVSDIGWARCWLPREFRTSFKMDGSAVYPETAWRIRNVGEPLQKMQQLRPGEPGYWEQQREQFAKNANCTPTPPNTPAGYSDEVVARMAALVERIAADCSYMDDGRSFGAEARETVALLPETVDADRAAAVDLLDTFGGALPDSVSLATAAIRRGRALAAEGR